MRIAEKIELPKQEVQNIAEFALAAGFQTPEPLVTIWLEYLSYLRRNTSYSSEKEVEILRATFSLAWDSLGRQFGVLADSNCEILQMWGRMEYGPLSDLVKGKELWTTVMESADNPNKSALWIEFSHLELRKGVDGARKVFRKAVASPELDDLEVIVAAWIRFERCNGTLDQLKACQEQCAQIQSRARRSFGNNKQTFVKKNNFPQKDGKNPFNKDATKKAPPTARDKKRKQPATSSTDENETVLIIRKHKNDAPEGDVPQKRQKMDRPSGSANDHKKETAGNHESHSDPSKDNVTVFLSNLSYDLTENEIIAAFPELHIQNLNVVTGPTGKSRGFGYAELLSPREVTLALTFDRRPINGRPTFISSVLRDKEKRGTFKYAVDVVEPTKLFVKGLPHDASKEELQEIFGEIGAVKDIRLVCHK